MKRIKFSKKICQCIIYTEPLLWRKATILAVAKSQVRLLAADYSNQSHHIILPPKSCPGYLSWLHLNKTSSCCKAIYLAFEKGFLQREFSHLTAVASAELILILSFSIIFSGFLLRFIRLTICDKHQHDHCPYYWPGLRCHVPWTLLLASDKMIGRNSQ